MQVPLRLLAAVRPSEHPGLLFGTAYGTAVLSVGPFLLPAVAAEYGIGLGLASLSTALQLAGFVVGSWGAGRFLHPRGRVLAGALAVAVVVNALSALLPAYPLLVGLRVLSGLSLGVITWFSWSQVFGDRHRMSEIAVVGPIVGISTTPIAAELISRFGPEGVYVALAVTAMVPMAFSRRSGRLEPEYLSERPKKSERHAPAPSARRVLVCLGLLTVGGSSVFTYGAVIAADRTSLSTNAIALSFSANALASIPSARWTGRRRLPGAWLLGCAASAVVMGAVPLSAAFVLAITFWGFSFWMGVPGAYTMLAEQSRYPEERAGDAQAIMAAGRVVGPLAGGVLLDATNSTVLGFVGGGLIAAAGIGLILVARSAPPGPEQTSA